MESNLNIISVDPVTACPIQRFYNYKRKLSLQGKKSPAWEPEHSRHDIHKKSCFHGSISYWGKQNASQRRLGAFEKNANPYDNFRIVRMNMISHKSLTKACAIPVCRRLKKPSDKPYNLSSRQSLALFCQNQEGHSHWTNDTDRKKGLWPWSGTQGKSFFACQNRIFRLCFPCPKYRYDI